GLWVDYELMTTIPGLFAIGEANFSDHGANRLGASALMQALADGSFIVPYTVAGYLAGAKARAVGARPPQGREGAAAAGARVTILKSRRGRRTAAELHRDLGKVLWDGCGLSRSAEGLVRAQRAVRALADEFRQGVLVPAGDALNAEVERALV